MRWDAVIWDFNGTLVDDVDLALAAINTMLARRGLSEVSRTFYRSVFGFPLMDYYRRLGIDTSRETPEGLSEEFHALYLPGLPACRLQAGVREALDAVAHAGARQFVLSALEQGLLRDALRALDIDDLFEGVYGLKHRLADSKLARGRELFAHHRLRPASTVMVGDMDHDAEVADALGIQVALVAQGHQGPESLGRRSDRVFTSFRELRADFEAPV